jgi:Na+/melibiose symporter-like transporter
LIWILGLGAFGLAFSITTVAAYLPPVLAKFTDSSTLIGLVLAAEGVFAFFIPFLVGPMSDSTQTPLGRRRPYMLLALGPMAVTLGLVAFMPNLLLTALALFGLFFAYYVYEPPYRGLARGAPRRPTCRGRTGYRQGESRGRMSPKPQSRPR